MAPSQNVQQPPSSSVKFWRKVYRPLGFRKGYNFPLFIITVGAMLGFCFARFQYLNISGIYIPNSAPGEQYWFHPGGFRRIGIVLHLGAILPAGFLVCFQFVPVIRHKFLLFHRLNGYMIMLLFLISTAGVSMIARHTIGGDPSTQAVIGVTATLTTVSLAIAYYNIKRLQIDQHRAWMLRTWIYAGSIITLRPIMFATNAVLVGMGDYYHAMPCAEIYDDYASLGIPDAGNPAYQIYPSCPAAGSVAVHIDNSGPENAGATFQLTFGMAFWIALVIHAIGVEVYLSLTPAEGERLRMVAYERQLEAGYMDPGRAGLTVDRFGDAPKWRPTMEEHKVEFSQEG